MYEAAVIGVSAGGMNALKVILSNLSASLPFPLVIVQHVAQQADAYLVDYLSRSCSLKIKEAEDKEPLRARTVYIAPAGYHLLIEPDYSFSLSVDPRVNFSCPSIDVLFESAADVFTDRLIGIVLTGANNDGSRGLAKIKSNKGLAIVQNPKTAEMPYMPQAAITAVHPDYVVNLEDIAPLLQKLQAAHSKGEIYGRTSA